jgi:hypothetical protein
MSSKRGIYTWKFKRLRNLKTQLECYELSKIMFLVSESIGIEGARCSVVVKAYASNRKVAGSIPDEVISKFT